MRLPTAVIVRLGLDFHGCHDEAPISNPAFGDDVLQGRFGTPLTHTRNKVQA
jgi:hypothetical protein